jgi:hypothetical protein
VHCFYWLFKSYQDLSFRNSMMAGITFIVRHAAVIIWSFVFVDFLFVGFHDMDWMNMLR